MSGVNLLPSKNNRTYWLCARNQSEFNNNTPIPRHVGKFLIFHSLETIDANWGRIKAATEAGMLGHFCSVSTAKHDSVPLGGRKYTRKVICVFTYDENDYADVVRVRSALETLGYYGELGYKGWKATKTKQYATPGRSVCLYRM